jgi:hypothetical protein
VALTDKVKRWQGVAGFAGRDNKSVALIPKAGCQSIRHAIGKSMKPEEAWACDTRLAFIRHPQQRLESAYSFFFG